MSKSQVVRGRGRPEKFNKNEIRALKAVVRANGLIAGRDIINKNGINLFGKVKPVNVSLPTLSKYVSRDNGKGNGPVVLKRGRPSAKAA